jgi:putative methyltransferase (TIGR04325 family)
LSLRDIGKAVLSTQPCLGMLAGVGRSPFGRELLNRLSNSGGVYDTFQEGWAAAKRVNPVGHEDPEEIEVHLRVSQTLRPSDYAALFWFLKIDAENLRIFDYGGNVGNLYYSYMPYLKNQRKIEWTVFDIPSVVENGKMIAAKNNASGLTFVKSVGGVFRPQVLFLSGAFHYWEGTVEEFLRQFTAPPEHIIVNRSPVHETKHSFVTVQHTRTCAFPCVVRNAAEMISDFAAMDYVMVDRWNALELTLRLPLFPEWSVAAYSGFYFRLQKYDGDNPTRGR